MDESKNATNTATNAATPDFDVYGAMDWKDGVGTLTGSELKVHIPTIAEKVQCCHIYIYIYNNYYIYNNVLLVLYLSE